MALTLERVNELHLFALEHKACLGGGLNADEQAALCSALLEAANVIEAMPCLCWTEWLPPDNLIKQQCPRCRWLKEWEGK